MVASAAGVDVPPRQRT